MEKKQLRGKGRSLAGQAVLEERRSVCSQDSGSIRSSVAHWPLPSRVNDLHQLESITLDHFTSSRIPPALFGHCKANPNQFFTPLGPQQENLHAKQQLPYLYRSRATDLVGYPKFRRGSARGSALPPQHPECYSRVPASAASFMRERGMQQAQKSQMTIFYRGRVIVYDDISSAKARDIMQLASKRPTASSTSANSSVQTPEVDCVEVMDCSSASNCLPFASSMAMKPVDSRDPAVTTSQSRLRDTQFSPVPQARKATLARFLEKRKERLINFIPYFHRKSSLDASEVIDCGNSAKKSKSGVKRKSGKKPLLPPQKQIFMM